MYSYKNIIMKGQPLTSVLPCLSISSCHYYKYWVRLVIFFTIKWKVPLSIQFTRLKTLTVQKTVKKTSEIGLRPLEKNENTSESIILRYLFSVKKYFIVWTKQHLNIILCLNCLFTIFLIIILNIINKLWINIISGLKNKFI